MATTLLDRNALSRDADFLYRVQQAIVEKSIMISTETVAGLRPDRKSLAAKVLKSPVVEAANFSILIAANGAVAAAAGSPASNAAVADALITAAIDSVWDGYAQIFDKE